MAAPKPEWGNKHTCPACAAMFYDMRKKTVVCPKCRHTFTEEELKPATAQRVKEKISSKPETEDSDTAEENLEDIEAEEIIADDFLEDDELSDDDDEQNVINIDIEEE